MVKDYFDTICAKVDACQVLLQEAIRTKEIDELTMSKILSAIQIDATKMEEALKANKVLRLKHGIDKEYREMMNEKFTPPGINNMDLLDKVKPTNGHNPKYEFTLTDETGKILYKNKLKAFLLCAVERIEDVDAAGVINGQVQTIAIGADMAMYYAFDQLRQQFAMNISELILKHTGSVESGLFTNRKERRKFVKAANGGKV